MTPSVADPNLDTPSNLAARLIRQREPFQFLTGINEINDQYARGTGVVSSANPIIAGHFPGMPIVPGVLLLEAMGQLGISALGSYLLERQGYAADAFLFFATDVRMSLYEGAAPDVPFTVTADVEAWRSRRLRVKTSAWIGTKRIAAGSAAGMAIEIHREGSADGSR